MAYRKERERERERERDTGRPPRPELASGRSLGAHQQDGARRARGNNLPGPQRADELGRLGAPSKGVIGILSRESQGSFKGVWG